MHLRKLMVRDADRMFEWMHNENVTKFMKANFHSFDRNTCVEFIKEAELSKTNIHLAIANDEDIYIGTVSLKSIDYIESIAEFAIVMHCDAIGTGDAICAMQQILRIGHSKMNIKDIYWCVRQDNLRAYKFYVKNGYKTIDSVPQKLIEKYKDENNLVWFKD